MQQPTSFKFDEEDYQNRHYYDDHHDGGDDDATTTDKAEGGGGEQQYCSLNDDDNNFTFDDDDHYFRLPPTTAAAANAMMMNVEDDTVNDIDNGNIDNVDIAPTDAIVLHSSHSLNTNISNEKVETQQQNNSQLVKEQCASNDQETNASMLEENTYTEEKADDFFPIED